MSVTVGDDFSEFVVARWPDLESAARVVVLDPALARTTTVDALARLRQRWHETVEGGRPGDEARRAVLRAALDAATHRGSPTAPAPDAVPPSVAPAGSSDDPAGVPAAAPWEGETGDEDPVVAALVSAIRSAPPLERAVLAAATLWDCGPEDVARLLGAAPVTVGEHAASLRSRLTSVHDTARVASGLEPSPWARDQDVAAAVEVLLRGLTDPPDPTALVAERGRGLRRRTLVAGATAVVALGGVAAVVARRATRSTTATAGGPSAPTSLAPDDPRWASADRWPARGPLAGDPALASLISRGAARGDHVLWAGDLGTRRVVLVWTRPDDGDGVGTGFGLIDTFVRMFEGPSGTDPTRLVEAVEPFLVMPGTTDVVAVTLQDGPSEEGDRSLLLVLARPTVATASVSYLVRPTRDGTLDRSWSPLALEQGVLASVLDRSLPLAMRLRVAGWEGAPGSATTAFDLLTAYPQPSTSPEWAEGPISALTGIPVDRLTTTVHVDEEVPRGLFDGSTPPPGAEPGRVVSLLTTTPDGAVLRTTAFRSDGSTLPLEPGVLLPAGRQAEPLVVQASDLRPQVSRFLVVAPGAHRVQLISSSPDGYPVSKVEPTGGRAAVVVPVVNGNRAGQYRLVTRDRRGRVLFDGVPVSGRFLLDG